MHVGQTSRPKRGGGRSPMLRRTLGDQDLVVGNAHVERAVATRRPHDGVDDRLGDAGSEVDIAVRAVGLRLAAADQPVGRPDHAVDNGRYAIADLC